ncbi:D-alanyl-D-alanine carboxypeptidase/D-alanyl-D-alanine endopeptidase [Virgibacillus senegalensis]|uniref:D-alanyl-D-alanine carboxypeptidase/D-alanyl-D-alanine endopeptidase n=1 Tax=Virgibacillus senegalensis TaxID=1499679 RepID=UPI00069F2C56|nr:D-alanyl-D-alanine carboxypeptidase/D-alanyl-D-alanine-endopeptidase [Virgibacillus senegalensis]
MSIINKRIFVLLLFAILIFLPLSGQTTNMQITAADDSPQSKNSESNTLKQKLDAILADDKLAGTVTGVSIRKAETGELIYSQNGNTRLRPASNMKLLTSSAALETLGADYQFSTEVWTDGTIKGNVLHGNLYLKGKGDPTLLEEDLQQFAAALQKQGIQNIKGNLVGDDTWYDNVRLSEDLNWSDEPFYTGAQVSALTLSPDTDYDAGTVIIEVTPSDQIGKPAKVRMMPENDYITINNKSKMVGEEEAKDISITRQHGNNEIVIDGQMPLNGSTSKSWSSVWEPTGYTLDVFKHSLAEEGITFSGKTDITFSQTPEQAQLLAQKKSMPLQELLIPFMKLSNNGHGEILTKEMGKVEFGEGSWDKGLQVTESVAAELGIETDTIQLRDGSGMSHKTYLPANSLSQLLYHAQEKSWFPIFEQSLPIAGISDRLVGGTLRSRMKQKPAKGNVKAKTGSLNSVSTLSGYVTAKDGEKLIFSILVNNYLGSSSGITAIEDEIASILAKHEF